jgi:enamine deaminase RidA (YjgF/YER057c/UK114 family)
VASASRRLADLGLRLPDPPKPAGAYVPVARVGELAWVSGQIVVAGGSPSPAGTVDQDVPFELAKETARRASLQALSALGHELGSIDRIRRILRVGVFVAVSPGFHREHEVANGATEFLAGLFGDDARPSRVAIGVASLPLNAPVEVEMVVATDPAPPR